MRLKSLAVVALLAAGAFAWAASGAGPWLRLEHRLKLAAKRWSKTVTRVEVPGAEPFSMFLNPDDRTVSPALWTWGLWEPNETRWFVRSLRPGDVVVDVGANIGYYTLLGARLVGESGRVYAFEPDPASFEILARNVQGEERPAIAVEAVALDDYFADHPDGVDFVKVEAQGAEGVILDGMRGLIERSDELVMAFEYSPRALAGMRYHAPQLLRVFRKSGFTLFDLGSGGEPPRSRMAPVGAA